MSEDINLRKTPLWITTVSSITMLAIFVAVLYQLQPSLAKSLKSGAEKLSRKLPMKTDLYTTLVGVQAIDESLIYRYSIEVPRDARPDLSSVPELQRAKACATPGMRDFLRAGATIIMESRWADTKTIAARAEINEASCERGSLPDRAVQQHIED